jgi:transposase-like protein
MPLDVFMYRGPRFALSRELEADAGRQADKKELVGLIDGVRESAQSWKELLLDLKRRGLAMGPELAVADGAVGFWQAVEEVWPRTRGQRCWVHKTANVLNKLPKSQ